MLSEATFNQNLSTKCCYVLDMMQTFIQNLIFLNAFAILALRCNNSDIDISFSFYLCHVFLKEPPGMVFQSFKMFLEPQHSSLYELMIIVYDQVSFCMIGNIPV